MKPLAKAHLTLQLFDGEVVDVSWDKSGIPDKEAYRMMISSLTLQLDAHLPGGEPLNDAERAINLSRVLLASARN